MAGVLDYTSLLFHAMYAEQSFTRLPGLEHLAEVVASVPFVDRMREDACQNKEAELQRSRPDKLAIPPI